MKNKISHYLWAKQKFDKNYETIHCKEYDCYQDFKRDPTGYYVLIKVDFASCRIEVGICDKRHRIIKVFSGRKCQDIYDAIFDYEQRHKINWFKEKTHIAYLGKEIKKAEMALAMGQDSYFQE